MGRIEDLILLSPQLQHFLTEGGYAYGTGIGECGLLGSEVVLNWREANAYFEAGRRGDREALTNMARELGQLGRDLMAVVAGEAHMDGAYDKMFCRMHDRRFPLRLLPPYQYVSDETFERFAAVLREKYPRWVPA
jgi:hypothetical protein